jgi:hypothetical protein
MAKVLVNKSEFQLHLEVTNGNHSYHICLLPKHKVTLEPDYSVSVDSKNLHGVRIQVLDIDDPEPIKSEETTKESDKPVKKDTVSKNPSPDNEGDK